MRIAFLTLLFHGTLLLAQPAGDVTPLPRADAGKWGEVKAELFKILPLSGGEKTTEWELIDRAGADLYFAADKPGVASFVASKPGKYRVVAVVDGKLNKTVVTVAGDGPDVPDPPAPKPPEPKPDAGLVKKLQAAYAEDAGAMKATDLKQLVALYLEAVAFAGNPDIVTAGALLDAIRGASASLVPAGRLTGLRAVLAAELVASLPTDAAAVLDADGRKAAAALFGRLAKALGGVMP